MEAIEDYDQEEVDELVQAVGWAIYQDEHAEYISEVAVEDSGLGNYEDKITKKQRKIEGVLSDTLGEPSVGVIDTDEENGLVDIAKPVGVVGAVVPATHPGASPTALTMMALKGRNAIVLSPSPRGEKVCEIVVDYIHEELERVGAPTDLVQMIPRPASKDKTYELMDRVDLLQVTGSASNVEAGETSGTPNYCVGEGNAVAIVDETANLEATAERIRKSQTVDNGTSCSSDNSAVLLDAIYDEAMAELEAAGGYLCEGEEREKLKEAMFPEGYGSLSMDVVAQPTEDIADVAGLESPEARNAEFFMVKGEGVGPDYPMSSEKLSSVCTIFRADDLEEALDRTQEILAFEGNGHSCGIHTNDEETVMRTGRAIDVARVIVNQPHAFANGGWRKNGLPNTLSEGGGTWAGNQLAGNVNYEHFIQTTTVAKRLDDRDRQSAEELFASYHETHGL
jgi:sulfoacetaldehyde dehydrogenase